jgi:hypothetical protein
MDISILRENMEAPASSSHSAPELTDVGLFFWAKNERDKRY